VRSRNAGRRIARARQHGFLEGIVRFAAILALGWAIGTAGPSALAQQAVDQASVSGRVTDQSGGVVIDAQVTARQTATNLTTVTATDGG
jgi:hypothetical protein